MKNKNLVLIFLINHLLNLLTEFFKDKNNSDSANIHLGDMKMISEKYCLENGDKDNDNIDMIKHIKKNGG